MRLVHDRKIERRHAAASALRRLDLVQRVIGTEHRHHVQDAPADRGQHGRQAAGVAGGADIRLGQTWVGPGVHRADRHHGLGAPVPPPGQSGLRDQIQRRHPHQGELRSERARETDRHQCLARTARGDVQAPGARTVQMPHRTLKASLLIRTQHNRRGSRTRDSRVSGGGTHTRHSPRPAGEVARVRVEVLPAAAKRPLVHFSASRARSVSARSAQSLEGCQRLLAHIRVRVLAEASCLLRGHAAASRQAGVGARRTGHTRHSGQPAAHGPRPARDDGQPTAGSKVPRRARPGPAASYASVGLGTFQQEPTTATRRTATGAGTTTEAGSGPVPACRPGRWRGRRGCAQATGGGQLGCGVTGNAVRWVEGAGERTSAASGRRRRAATGRTSGPRADGRGPAAGSPRPGPIARRPRCGAGDGAAGGSRPGQGGQRRSGAVFERVAGRSGPAGGSDAEAAARRPTTRPSTAATG